MAEEDEPALIARLAAGDANAFGTLYDVHSPAVHRFVWQLLPDRELAADAVQETFLVAWRRRRAIRLATDTLLPWLLAIARFVAMNELRRQRRHPDGGPAPVLAMAASPEAQAEARIELVRVLNRINGLEALDREILQLCIFDGLSYSQAARRLHITPTSIGKRIERSRKRLGRESYFGTADEGRS